VQRVAISCQDIEARVNGQFGTFEFGVIRNGNTFTLSKQVEVWGKIGIMFMGYDKLNGASNRNGIPEIQLKIDEKEQLAISIDKIPFGKTRQIETYIDYEIKQQKNRYYQKLFIDDGNNLDFYPVKHSDGYININDTLSHKVEITLNDSYGNKSFIHITLRGVKHQPGQRINNSDFSPSRVKVYKNTLIYMTKYTTDDSVSRIYTNRLSYALPPAYQIDDTWVYLWDLRKGIPDSIQTSQKVIIPGINVLVPSGLPFTYYQPAYDLYFYKNTLFDTLYINTEYIGELADDREFFMIDDNIYPLQKNMKIVFKPKKAYKYKNKLSAYLTPDLKHYYYAGGQLSNSKNELVLRTRTLGNYTLLLDTIPPSIKVVEQNKNRFRCYIRDTKSGIKSYKLTIGDEWVLLKADPKRNYYWTEKLDNTKPFIGELELKIIDQVNNIKTYKTIID